MKFEVINDKNVAVMSTEYVSCMPEKDELTSMSKAGYKFKLDGKSITVKKLREKLKEIAYGENN